MTINEIKATIKKEIIQEIEDKGYICDSDNCKRIIDILIRENIKFLDGIEEMEIDLIQDIENEMRGFLKKEYNQIGEIRKNGDYEGYFTKEKFESLEDLYTKFNIGE